MTTAAHMQPADVRSGDNSCIENGTQFVCQTNVAGSIPAKHMLHCCFYILGQHTAGNRWHWCNGQASQSSKLKVWVRIPYAAPICTINSVGRVAALQAEWRRFKSCIVYHAVVVQLAEHRLAKSKVTGSRPVYCSTCSSIPIPVEKAE